MTRSPWQAVAVLGGIVYENYTGCSQCEVDCRSGIMEKMTAGLEMVVCQPRARWDEEWETLREALVKGGEERICVCKPGWNMRA